MTIFHEPMIVIGVTFREFNGSDNERIQRLFIDSIKRQTYTKWKLVVTIFNEKQVQPEIERYGINTIFYRNGPVSEYKFSLTDVLLNAIIESSKEESSIIIWTTCDVIFEPDFFNAIVSNASKNFFAISHPHVTYLSINELGGQNSAASSLQSGMDLIIVDGSIFKNPVNLEIVNKYRFVDWGLFEHFLVGLSQLNTGKRINLFGVSNIAKIENDRKVGNETNEWLQKCWRLNKVQMDRFISDYRLTEELMNLTYCHMQFSLLKKKPSYFADFAIDYANYFKGYTKRKIGRTLPARVKSLIKKVTK